MKKLFTIFLLLLYIGSNAQQPNIDSLQKVLASHKKADTTKVQLYIDIAKGLLYSDTKKTEEAAKQALSLSEKLKWEKGVYLAKNSLGSVFYIQADYTRALDTWQQAYSLAEKRKDTLAMGSIMGNIGIVYNQIRDTKKAIWYFEKKLKLIKHLHNKKEEAITYFNIGNAYNLQHKYDQALAAYKQCEKISLETQEPQQLTHLYNSIGRLYDLQRKYETATYYFNKAIKYAEKTNDLNILAVIKNNLSKIYLTVPDYKQSMKLNEEALALAKQTKNRFLESEVYVFRTAYYIETNDYKKALETYVKYKNLSDSIIGDTKRKEIAQMEVKFEAEKKQALADEEIKHQKNIRNYSIAGIGVLLVASVAIFVFYKKHRDSVQKQKELLHKAQTAETEMRILRLQMNPHFIFNSLNSISDYMHKNDIEKADYYLAKFAKLMRGILENAEEKEITLGEEINIMEAYMQLEASRLKHKFTYEINIADDIDKENTYVLPLIMQPFIENSIWHGFANKDDVESVGKINIDISKNDDMLKYVIEDNGIGRKNSSSNKKSYGIKITNERLALLKNPKANIKIIDLAQGTRVEISLPFETEKVG